MADTDPRRVQDALAKLPRQHDTLRTTVENKEASTQEYAVQVFFDHTLVKTAYDERVLCWRAGASGATRSHHELAIKTVLRHIATERPDLQALDNDTALIEVGLIVGRLRRTSAGPAAARQELLAPRSRTDTFAGTSAHGSWYGTATLCSWPWPGTQGPTRARSARFQGTFAAGFGCGQSTTDWLASAGVEQTRVDKCAL
ncbi:hypothetical protein [Streptomyces sp. SP18BB07]|uniref:hypothetical protein n=1 Tax=Streptomyces sp. SP18BB07 TaxID=3002522 RepID=UPI002E7A8EEB|nr:hypothetical protein [Streptomyces sp. SP18BB07]MEE1761193.1 hypothetical protein [Streptomyces sp. SP18BB07]